MSAQLYSQHKSIDTPPGLASFKDAHKDEGIIVCGCGESLNLLENPEKYITIGVNDVGRFFQPDYLVVVNPPSHFAGDRFRYVETSQARYLFSQYDDLKVQHSRLIPFQLGKYGGTDFSDPNVLHFTQNSPYVALCLAIHMGAKRIGLIGVDFTEHHFFARTGRHVLSSRLGQIDREYAALGRACRERGIEIVNLSQKSLLTAFPKDSIEKLATRAAIPFTGTGDFMQRIRIFFVNYRFLSCGEVFTAGLRNAALELGLQHDEAYWDDPLLPAKVRDFKPDLLFVVHGRRFVQRWRDSFRSYKSAVWLLDEPYEVDDTSRFSGNFGTVFVSDPATVGRHKNAHYLPVCFDPQVHYASAGAKRYDVGFVGGYNPVREKMLEELYDEGLLSYVVGGPWKGKLRDISLSGNISHLETAELYRQTKIAVNIFRSVHHFNRDNLPARSLNPRVYEAVACGAAVVSEHRPEAETLFPAMPLFRDAHQLKGKIRELLNDPDELSLVIKSCHQGLYGNSYADRLKIIIEREIEGNMKRANHDMRNCETIRDPEWVGKADLPDGWEMHGDPVAREENGALALTKEHDDGPGAEQGLASSRSYSSVDICFEVNIASGSCFIAKLHQEDQFDQKTNSYHLMCTPAGDYLAKHRHVFNKFSIARDRWEMVRLHCHNGRITLYRNGSEICSVFDWQLKKGYCFLGLKGGSVRLRNIEVKDHSDAARAAVAKEMAYEVLHPLSGDRDPTVGIVTTVYDRIDCLRSCIKSVKKLNFRDYEQIIVSDSPPPEVTEQIKDMVEREDDGKIMYVNLKNRFNDWGITPATVGLQLLRGEYVSFLSDDNGYTPDHICNLVRVMEKDPGLGFAYSSCRYDGRLVLRSPVPGPGRIDLGQPMFRRELFFRYLEGKIPFNVMAWDWHMIETFVKNGVRWKHVDIPSFLFRLNKYPQYLAG